MQTFRSILAASALVLVTALPAFAQAEYMPEYRASKVMHVTVYNEKNEKIGAIEDIILSAKGGEPMAVLSVDAMVGSHKMVKVPLSHVRIAADKAMMPGPDGMKPALMAMPAYTFGLNGGGG